MKFLTIFLGITLALAIPFVGLFITSKLNDEAAVIITLIATPILAFYLKRYSSYKSLGLGMLIGLIPLSICTLMFITASKLH